MRGPCGTSRSAFATSTRCRLTRVSWWTICARAGSKAPGAARPCMPDLQNQNAEWRARSCARHRGRNATGMPEAAAKQMARSIGTLAVAGWVATACSSHAAETLKLTHQGIERTAILHRPAAAPAGPRPLVIILHGSGGGSAERIRGRIHFDVAADREGFVTLYPNAVGHEWKIRLPSARQAAPAVDDVGF